VHQRLQEHPYVFSRTLGNDRVVVALNEPAGPKAIPLFGAWMDGTELVDSYSGTRARVANGSIEFVSPYTIVLLSVPR
jgi:alpha-amylase